ncbi:MAG: UvrD-helicase domain-containing protein [Firmicutes bacterium]|nr:UvrD-helicase domain-containing protein [Bacillota bacterium]
MDKYDTLNEMQRKAVFQTEGPVLILAGAGSGKTRAITHRIAYLIEHKHVPAWQILAITFTNKAAQEMRQRADHLAGEAVKDAWIMTFHSFCLRILRRFGSLLGYASGFSIYDPEDQKAVMRRLIKSFELNEKMFTPREVLASISFAKNEMIGPDEYARAAQGNYIKEIYARLYRAYQEELMRSQAMDFDDILMKCVQLFAQFPDVLERYQEQFRYIMVDEYQDTNAAQYRLIRLLSARYRNICVVGDDDQSIYRFRGADIRNILDFEKDFPGCTVIRLEQNYRSTKTILQAANQVIANNQGRKAKTLWTGNPDGCRIKVFEADTEMAEAAYICSRMQKLHRQGRPYKDMAVLFRTNAQSRALEEALLHDSIPYRLYAGTPFYERKEIKDLLSYLRLINNDRDYAAARRVLNVPRRGIGDKTLNMVMSLAEETGMGVVELIGKANVFPDLQRSSAKLSGFAELILDWRDLAADPDTELPVILDSIMTRTGYTDYLREEDKERIEDRMENIDELRGRMESFQEESENPTLAGLVEELSLIAAIDNYDENADAVALMTLHSAKGLEFPVVFISGMEEGLFPSYRSITEGDEDDVEEERRLCYVGITRAQEMLFMTYARLRRQHGKMEVNKESRFMEEIPEEVKEEETIASSVSTRTEIIQKDESARTVYGQTRKFVKQYTAENSEEQLNRMMGRTPVQSEETAPVDWQKGDTVVHRKFGLGVISEVTPVGTDFRVKVNFVKAGEKVLLAGLAGLKKQNN